MGLLNDLRAEQRSPRLYRLRFESATLEHDFRSWQRRRHTIARVWLFGVLALVFGMTSMLDAQVFAVEPASLSTLRAVQWGLLIPMTVLGALVSHPDVESRLQRSLQTIIVSGIWSGMLAMRVLALRDGFNMPALFFGIVVIAVAFFGGFTWHRILVGVSFFTFAAMAIEYACATSHAGLQAYGLFWMAVIAVAGSYTHELLSRLAWLNGRYARELAASDGLTGLSNHYAFHRLLRRVIGQAAREQRNVAVALLDLDHFKSINDRYGHLFGDHVLREIGALLNRQFAQRPLDLRARYGGEELALVWYDVRAETLPALMESLLEAIREWPFTDPASGARVRVTASAGMCWLVPDANTAIERVLHAADMLLYGAKADGRNRARLAAFADCTPASGLPSSTATATDHTLLHG